MIAFTSPHRWLFAIVIVTTLNLRGQNEDPGKRKKRSPTTSIQQSWTLDYRINGSKKSDRSQMSIGRLSFR